MVIPYPPLAEHLEALDMKRSPFFKFYLGQKSLPLSEQEYESRLSLLKTSMFQYGIDACIFTSMHNIAHLEGIMRS